jgi:protein-S-isoprenylcysteine O-methyltransferase Ste14
MTLVLGSWVGFAVMLLFPLTMTLRIAEEEKLLVKELEGYEAYRQKVKWRMIPFVW